MQFEIGILLRERRSLLKELFASKKCIGVPAYLTVIFSSLHQLNVQNSRKVVSVIYARDII